MKVYLDTSVILAKLLGQADGLKDWGQWSQACTSEITRVEALRALERLRLEGRLDDAEIAERRQLLSEVLEAVDVIGLTAGILKDASGSFPTIVATLDAIHLSSAAASIAAGKGELELLTHDRQLWTAARAIGLATRGWK